MITINYPQTVLGPVCKTWPLQIKLFESTLYGPVANIAGLLVEEGLACFKEG